MLCRGAVWTLYPCRGPDGCVEVEGGIRCDQRIAVAGDPCIGTFAGGPVCSTDGRAELACVDETFQKVRDCVRCTVTEIDGNVCEQ